MEQRSGLRRLKPVTLGALPVVLLDTLAIVAVAALFAPIAILSLQGRQITNTAILIGNRS
ncbi:MAG: hypothetical protein WD555_02805 [Fulvivirga sp.]